MSFGKTAHLAGDKKPLTTLCGLPWERWQEPDIPTDVEIDRDSLPYAVKVEITRSDKARHVEASGPIRQCQACLKAAYRSTEGDSQ